MNSPQWAEHFAKGPRSLFFFPPAAVVMVTEKRLVSSGFIHAFVSGLYQATR